MATKFYKYQGTGNDFVIIDNRKATFKANTSLNRAICDRRMGIGADGLILLQDKPGYDFEMVYFNSDGNTSSMCGNGGRCIAHFAHHLGLFEKEANFLAIDGPHSCTIDEQGRVHLKMIDVASVEKVSTFNKPDCFLNTGSPHFIRWMSSVDPIEEMDMVQLGKEIRFSESYKQDGVNVNAVQEVDGGLRMRTYERGVEDETLSCGTGMVAAALAYASSKGKGTKEVAIFTQGGNASVRFEQDENGFSEIWLCGPAEMVFEGTFDPKSFS